MKQGLQKAHRKSSVCVRTVKGLPEEDSQAVPRTEALL